MRHYHGLPDPLPPKCVGFRDYIPSQVVRLYEERRALLTWGIREASPAVQNVTRYLHRAVAFEEAFWKGESTFQVGERRYKRFHWEDDMPVHCPCKCFGVPTRECSIASSVQCPWRRQRLDPHLDAIIARLEGASV